MMSDEEETQLKDEFAALNDRYAKLRTLYVESHLVWEATERQNVELRAAIHNLGG